ncbi:MAG TPA: cyclase family protein [Verrucomicrobiae bacterium]|nr:cyclase family protein [Verrucomicrobiae bacterium]
MKKPWIDVTITIRDGMVHWPGDVECRISQVLKLGAPIPGQKGKTSPCNLTNMFLSAHTGTHMDAPRHFIADGDTMESVPLEAVVGPCRVIEIRNQQRITVEELRPHKLKRGERILFKTRNSIKSWKLAKSGKFDQTFVYIPAETAGYLVKQGVRTVGVDYLSVGGWQKDSTECHQILLEAKVWIIEGLDLSKVKPGQYDLICLPLKILGADGAPARGILRKR